jgi:hypothetical protein
MTHPLYPFGLVDQAALFFTVAEKHVQDEQVLMGEG